MNKKTKKIKTWTLLRQFLFISYFFTNIYTIFFTIYLTTLQYPFFFQIHIYLFLYLLLFYPLPFLLYIITATLLYVINITSYCPTSWPMSPSLMTVSHISDAIIDFIISKYCLPSIITSYAPFSPSSFCILNECTYCSIRNICDFCDCNIKRFPFVIPICCWCWAATWENCCWC